MPKRRRTIDLSALSYDAAATVEGAHEGRETLSDWNRIAISGEKCNYYINGVKLSVLRQSMLDEGRCQRLDFKDVAELRDFFQEYVFTRVFPRETAEIAAQQACLRWHQAGIQHATNQDIRVNCTKNFPNIAISEPSTSIHFNSVPSGVVIIEDNRYSKWIENGKTIHHTDDYFVSTETKYFFKPGDPGTITLEDMKIDCREAVLKPVFAKYSQETIFEDYHHTLSEVKNELEPMLYYPQTRDQKEAICAHCRNCFYIDYDTKSLHYINAYRTVIPVKDTYLVSKEIETIQTVDKQKIIQFKLPHQKTNSEVLVPHHYDKKLGHVMHMTHAKMQMMIPESFETALLFKYGENMLRQLQHDKTLLSSARSLFVGDTVLATQERRAVLAIIQQFILKQPALQIRKYQQKPLAMTFSEQGESLYVFVANAKHPDQSRFWYVDRSEKPSKWIEFPITLDQMIQIDDLFDGETTHESDQSVAVTLSPDMCKKVANLLVSPLPHGQTLVEDLSYHEAYDALTNTLQTTEMTEDNELVMKRCTQIQDMLRYFGENFDHYFPETRGIMSYDKRIQVLNMMNKVIAEPHSPDTQHYFRNKHRIYKEAYDSNRLAEYDPSSFVWSDQSLYYINEARQPVEVPMTQAIHSALTKSNTYISAEEVYHLMTKPRLFHYVCGIPVGLNCRSLEFKYFEVFEGLYIPTSLGFNRAQGLHTGTAQEMMLEIRDIHLSLRTLLFKLFEFSLVVVLPTILQGFGYTIPLAWFGLTALEQSITNWFMLIWSASLFYTLLSWIGISNLLVRPEFNALDQALQGLSDELDKISACSLDNSVLSSDDDNTFNDDDRLSDDSDETVPYIC